MGEGGGRDGWRGDRGREGWREGAMGVRERDRR